MTFFYKDCINVFTDTSDRTLQTVRGEFKATCCGFASTYQGRIIDSGLEVWLDESTIFGEAKGVELALGWILFAAARGLRPPTAYNIFSDNHAVVAQINNYLIDWFYNLSQNERTELIYKGRDYAITWENVCYNIAYTIFTCGLPIRVFYTPGHVPTWNVPFKSFKTYREKFTDLNRKYHGDLYTEVETYITFEMGTFNNVVDMITRNFLFRHLYLIEEDIARAGDSVVLGSQKKLPVRWPFVLSNSPNCSNENATATLMLAQPK